MLYQEKDVTLFCGDCIEISKKEIKPKTYQLNGKGSILIEDLIRLDYDTKGLIFLTNDGDFTYKLTHPSHNIKKTYVAVVKGEFT